MGFAIAAAAARVVQSQNHTARSGCSSKKPTIEDVCGIVTNNDNQLLPPESAPLATARMCDLPDVAVVRLAAEWLCAASPKVELRTPKTIPERGAGP